MAADGGGGGGDDVPALAGGLFRVERGEVMLLLFPRCGESMLLDATAAMMYDVLWAGAFVLFLL